MKTISPPVYERQTQAASQRSCRRPGGDQELLKHPETSTATRWASRGETHVAPCSTRPHTHAHTHTASNRLLLISQIHRTIYKCTKNNKYTSIWKWAVFSQYAHECHNKDTTPKLWIAFRIVSPRVSKESKQMFHEQKSHSNQEKQKRHQTHACDRLSVSMLSTKQIDELKKGKTTACC